LSNKDIVSISSQQDYKISFGKVFIFMIILMVLEKVLLLFKDSPPLFNGADMMFHIFVNILSILSQLAASIAAAIIFFFCIEFVNKKKDLAKYIDLRRDLLFMQYSFMEILSLCSGFEKLKLGNLNKRYYDADTISLYNELLDFNLQDSRRDSFLQDIKLYILNNTEKFQKYLNTYPKHIQSLQKVKEYRFIKNSEEHINDIAEEFEETVGYLEIYMNPLNTEELKTDMNFTLDELAKHYLNFIMLTTFFCRDLNAFMYALNNKKLWTFMKLLD